MSEPPAITEIPAVTSDDRPGRPVLDNVVDNPDWADGDDAFTWDPASGADFGWLAGAHASGLTGAEGPPLTSGETRSAEDVARHLAHSGRSLDEARAMVRVYQDEASDRLGVPVHSWGLDDADLASIDTGPLPPAPALIPQRRTAIHPADGEAGRREQLARWHGDDAAVDAAYSPSGRAADDVAMEEVERR